MCEYKTSFFFDSISVFYQISLHLKNVTNVRCHYHLDIYHTLYIAVINTLTRFFVQQSTKQKQCTGIAYSSWTRTDSTTDTITRQCLRGPPCLSQLSIFCHPLLPGEEKEESNSCFWSVKSWKVEMDQEKEELIMAHLVKDQHPTCSSFLFVWHESCFLPELANCSSKAWQA